MFQYALLVCFVLCGAAWVWAADLNPSGQVAEITGPALVDAGARMNRPPLYVMEPRPRTVTAPKPPASGKCETCGRWARYLSLTWPDLRWQCADCTRPLEGGAA